MLFEQDELKNEWLSHQLPRNGCLVGSPLHLFTFSLFPSFHPFTLSLFHLSYLFTLPPFPSFHPFTLSLFLSFHFFTLSPFHFFILSPFHFFTLSPTI